MASTLLSWHRFAAIAEGQRFQFRNPNPANRSLARYCGLAGTSTSASSDTANKKAAWSGCQTTKMQRMHELANQAACTVVFSDLTTALLHTRP